MLFNSIDFALFLPVVFALYWIVGKKNHHAQNLVVVIASYVFYGWWDWRFLSLILISTLVDYFAGQMLCQTRTTRHRKLYLYLSLITNLGILIFFKYWNFFIDSFTQSFSFFGVGIEGPSLNLILPVGISFYTFQTLSYSIDVYRKKMNACKDFVAFAAYVSFFPQLVAGPIERATHLVPIFQNPRQFSYSNAVDGLKQMLWGFFKKIVIADNCAVIVNYLFESPGDYNSWALILGVIFFAFQIYGDFSGYSDIAIGVSKLFGVELMDNFAYPYFSRDVAEFWRRWHISLSTWFRDYLYVPLGGSQGSKAKQVRNILIVFVVSGLWHGPNWTFVVWGLLNALFFLPLLLMNKNRVNIKSIPKEKRFPGFFDFLKILGTFALINFSWVFFRAESLSHAFEYFHSILSSNFFAFPQFQDTRAALLLLVLIVFLLAIEWIGRHEKYAIKSLLSKSPRVLRWVWYYGLAFAVFAFANNSQVIEFIYFQF